MQALSLLLFLMAQLSDSHSSDVFLYIRYISFTYALMGAYLCTHGLFSSIDSTISVFLFSIVLGLIMTIYAIFGARM
ncbi:unnamed protein product [Ixodes hexagonus]